MATTAQGSDFDRAKGWAKKFLADWKARHQQRQRQRQRPGQVRCASKPAGRHRSHAQPAGLLAWSGKGDGPATASFTGW